VAKKHIVRVTRLWLAGMIEECEKRGISSFLVAVVKGKAHNELTCEILEDRIRPKFVIKDDGNGEDEEVDQSAEIESLKEQLVVAENNNKELEKQKEFLMKQVEDLGALKDFTPLVEIKGVARIMDIIAPEEKEHDAILDAIDHEVINALETEPETPQLPEKRGPGRPPVNKDKK